MSLILLGILNSQVSGAAAGAYDLLETVELSSSASYVEITGLDSYTDYKHLQLRYTARSDRSGFTQDNLNGYFNSDFSTSNYASHLLYGTGSSVLSGGYAPAAMQVDALPAASETANVFAAGVMDILDFSNTSKNTTMRNLSGKAGSSVPRIFLWSGLWNSTSAVTSIWLQPFGGNIIAGSRFSLYGVK